jgi:hypothetical protein
VEPKRLQGALAKKNQTRKAETTKQVAANPEPVPPVAPTAAVRTELEIANPDKTKGSVQYRIPGVAGSLRVARSLFAGTPPARLIVVGPFAAPDPEKEAKARETAEQRAAKLEERIARANATAAKERRAAGAAQGEARDRVSRQLPRSYRVATGLPGSDRDRHGRTGRFP